MNRMKRSIMLLMVFIFLLAGCGKVEQVEQKEPTQKYNAKYHTLTEVLEPYSERLCLTAEAFYHMREKENQDILFRRDLTKPEEGSEVLRFEVNQSTDCFTVTKEGEIVLAMTQFALGEDGTPDYSMPSEKWLCKYDQDGKMLWEKEIAENVGEAVLIHVDVQGRIYLLSHDSMLHTYDTNGKKQGRLHIADVYSIASTPEGQIFLANNAEIRKLTTETGVVESEMALGGFALYHTGEVLGLIDDTYLYTYDAKHGQAPVKCVNLLEYYINVNQVLRLAMNVEGQIAILCRDGLESKDVELIVLSPEEAAGNVSADTDKQEKKENAPKVALKMVALEPTNYSQMIIDFNRASDTASVELMKLAGEGGLETRIGASLLSENAPDMIQMKSGLMSDGYHKYADGGYLVDLTPYLENSKVLDKSDFAEWVLEDFTVDGKIYALPTMMTFQTILCPTDYLEGRTNWTIEEFLDFLEQYPNAFGGGSNTVQNKEVYLQSILMCGKDAFIDREKGVSYLDGERFRNVLRRIKNLKMEETTKTWEERVDAGEVLAKSSGIVKSNRSFADAQWRLFRGKEVTLMGYPTAEAMPGGEGCHNIGYYNMIGITTTCEHPEEAWKFIEQNLLQAITGEVSYFPTGKEALEKKLQEETEAEYDLTEADEKLLRQMYGDLRSVGVIIPEQVEKVRSGLENSFWYARDVDDSLYIILEEVRPYFEGQKSLDEVVEILQNRMQLYYDEQR